MKKKLQRLYRRLQYLARSKEGQDLVEYALTVAMVALGATASMHFFATGITSALGGISSNLGSYIS